MSDAVAQLLLLETSLMPFKIRRKEREKRIKGNPG
jgi:hypothetical protein